MSEIDDIFSSKGKQKDRTPSLLESEAKKKKKGKDSHKRKREPGTASGLAESHSKTIPQTVHDSSTSIPITKRLRTDKNSAPVLRKPSKKTIKDDKDIRFRDSRGTGQRKRTEEGWNIYEEAELDIRDDGGDTPLCPFDCDCCF